MHYQYLEIGHDCAISKIATEEARHDHHAAFRDTRYRHTDCRGGGGCYPLATAARGLPDDAASNGPPNCAADGTSARHRGVGPGLRFASMSASERKRTG